jgi:hypothetical protein
VVKRYALNILIAVKKYKMIFYKSTEISDFNCIFFKENQVNYNFSAAFAIFPVMMILKSQEIGFKIIEPLDYFEHKF